MHTFTLEVLASGSGGNAYLLHSKHVDGPLLIEAGVPVAALQELLLPRPLSSLGGIVITHRHVDHAQGLPGLLSRTSVPVVASSDVLEAFKVPANRRAEYSDAPSGTARMYYVNGFTIAAHPGVHDVPVDVFQFFSHGQSVVFATDTRTIPAKHMDLRHVNILAIEANYDPDALLRNPDRAQVQRVWSNHMSIDTCETYVSAVASVSLALEEVVLLHVSSRHGDAGFVERVKRVAGVPVTLAPERKVTA